jgi:hypothetical protein
MINKKKIKSHEIKKKLNKNFDFNSRDYSFLKSN